MDSLRLEARRDSINRAAEDTNFIHAYILIASPGREVYSCFGHAAIRLQCPSNNLDYCFTFEIDQNKSGVWDFVRHKSKAGFAATTPDVFLQQYNDEGRGVKQYELNLTPHEKQHLWALLDQQLEKGSTWTFDFYDNSCSSMVWWAISNSLEDEQLSFPNLPDCVKGNYYDAVSYMAEKSPWYGLVWHMIALDGGPDDSDVTTRLAPRMMAEVLPTAVIVNSNAETRPLLKGKVQQLLPMTYIDHPCWLRPWMAVCIFVIILICLLCFRFKILIHNKK